MRGYFLLVFEPSNSTARPSLVREKHAVFIRWCRSRSSGSSGSCVCSGTTSNHFRRCPVTETKRRGFDRLERGLRKARTRLPGRYFVCNLKGASAIRGKGSAQRDEGSRKLSRGSEISGFTVIPSRPSGQSNIQRLKGNRRDQRRALIHLHPESSGNLSSRNTEGEIRNIRNSLNFLPLSSFGYGCSASPSVQWMKHRSEDSRHPLSSILLLCASVRLCSSVCREQIHL